MSNDELKYKKLRDSLRSLPRLKAKSDFEARLFRKIKEHESHGTLHAVPETGSRVSLIDFLANLLRPSLVPAVGLTVVILVSIAVYFVYFSELKKEDAQQVETIRSEKNGEFIIYVHKDGDRIYDETARDITSAELEQPGTMYSPVERSTDGYSKPDETDSEIRARDDRISNEQKLEMEKESTPKIESDELKTMPKKDDAVIMKKSGKTDDSKEAPLNIRKETEDTGSKDKGLIEEQKTDEPAEINQQTEGKSMDEDKNRISRSKKDSLKAKDKKIEEQKDSIEK